MIKSAKMAKSFLAVTPPQIARFRPTSRCRKFKFGVQSDVDTFWGNV